MSAIEEDAEYDGEEGDGQHVVQAGSGYHQRRYALVKPIFQQCLLTTVADPNPSGFKLLLLKTFFRSACKREGSSGGVIALPTV